MSQNKKKKTVQGRRGKKAGLSWQVQAEKRSGLLAALIIVGVLLALGCFILQQRGIFALDTDRRAAENSTVRINEIVSRNEACLITDQGDVPDWVEIINTGNEPVEIGRCSLLLQSNINNMFSFPEYTLQPGEILLVYCEGRNENTMGEWSAPFKLEASGGDSLILLDVNGKVIDGVQMPELDSDRAYLRDADGAWSIGRPTPGMDNASTEQRSAYSEEDAAAWHVELSEASSANTLYFADENGEHHDYVELHNTGSAEINLAGWHLSDSSDRIKRWVFPDVVIPAGGYVAVHCSGYNRTGDPNHLHTDFKLSSDGEGVYLSQSEGRVISQVELPALEANRAYSLVDGVWSADLPPTPGMENTLENTALAQAQAFGSREQELRLNEIMTSAAEQEYDWVEIYNGSAQTVNLSGYGLSDNAKRPRKWQFPEGTTIRPGEYLGVYLSGTDAKTIDGFLNADFALASAGGYMVSLSDPDGNVLDAVHMPRQYSGISYGRVQGQDGFFLMEKATPGTENGQGSGRTRAQEARASVQGGLFESGDSFTVELSAEPGSRIYYSLDCTDPDDSAKLYTGPISISKTTILRTRVYREGCMPSAIDTQSYLFDVNNQGDVYVVSLVSDPDNLFSSSRGIMVKGPNAFDEFPYGKTNQGANFWMDWERDAHVELFEADGDTAFSQNCGIKLHGQYSRATDVKAFKVIARKEYGARRFEYPIFSQRDYDQYQSFLLRASGQDYNLSFMRDSVLSRLAKDTSVMYMESEVAVCYLNGEYYSLFNLRERVNKFSICQFEGWEGMEDDIDLIKANDIVMQGSNDSFAELLSWVKKNDMSTQAAYDYINERIDIQNYIEYMAIQCFVGNNDTLNVKRYRNARADGKWKWVLFDLDWAFSVDSNSLSRWLTPGGMGTGGRTDNTLFIACMENPTFRQQFVEHLSREMAATFTSENVMAMFNARYQIIEELLPAYQRKWGIKASYMQEQLQELISYINSRPGKMLGYIKKALRFSDSQMQQYFSGAMDAVRAYSGK